MDGDPLVGGAKLGRRAILGRAAATGAALGLMTPRGAAGAQDATPVAIRSDSDVVYGVADDTPLLLDVFYPPAREAPRPAVVLVHGGGLAFGSRADVFEQARALARAGYVAFAIEYRLFAQYNGTNPWPAQLDDAQRAVRWVRANAAAYGVDPARLAAYGHSSGGRWRPPWGFARPATTATRLSPASPAG